MKLDALTSLVSLGESFDNTLMTGQLNEDGMVVLSTLLKNLEINPLMAADLIMGRDSGTMSSFLPFCLPSILSLTDTVAPKVEASSFSLTAGLVETQLTQIDLSIESKEKWEPIENLLSFSNPKLTLFADHRITEDESAEQIHSIFGGSIGAKIVISEIELEMQIAYAPGGSCIIEIDNTNKIKTGKLIEHFYKDTPDFLKNLYDKITIENITIGIDQDDKGLAISTLTFSAMLEISDSISMMTTLSLQPNISLQCTMSSESDINLNKLVEDLLTFIKADEAASMLHKYLPQVVIEDLLVSIDDTDGGQLSVDFGLEFFGALGCEEEVNEDTSDDAISSDWKFTLAGFDFIFSSLSGSITVSFGNEANPTGELTADGRLGTGDKLGSWNMTAEYQSEKQISFWDFTVSIQDLSISDLVTTFLTTTEETHETDTTLIASKLEFNYQTSKNEKESANYTMKCEFTSSADFYLTALINSLGSILGQDFNLPDGHGNKNHFCSL